MRVVGDTTARTGQSTPAPAWGISWALAPLGDDDRDDAEKLRAVRELLCLALGMLGDAQRETRRLEQRLYVLLNERRARPSEAS